MKNVEYLLNLDKDQYNDYEHIEYIFSLPDEENKILKIIKYNTNYYINYEIFLNILKNNMEI